jgi:3-oxoacyl-[acyl-carrier-protein] synthase I
MNKPCYLSGLGIINALGSGASAVSAKLLSGDTSGIVLEDGLLLTGSARVGRVRGTLEAVPAQLQDFDSRNNQLLLTALVQIESLVEAAINRYGQSRVGIVLGSSTSGIAEGEAAIAAQHLTGSMPAAYRYTQQEIGSAAVFLARFLKVTGPAYTVSNACTSSAKVFQSARNLLRHGICDAVIVGGVDTLCRTTINGFASLESITAEHTNPMSINRRGINIGEGAALFLLTQEPSEIALLGIGESSDAYHMSAPHPEGRGAEQAMRLALQDARLEADAIGYLNLHATATMKNDEMESLAVARVFPNGVPCSGTKPLTGHTLGAAGATELAFCILAMQANQLPPHVWDEQTDPSLPRLNLIGKVQKFMEHTSMDKRRRVCMTNSFAFGGSNTSLVIGENR